MLRSMNEMCGYALTAEDGAAGRCRDFLFDDRHWLVHHMVADTQRWPPGRQVLVPRTALGEPDRHAAALSVRLTAREVQAGPDVDHDPPMSRSPATVVMAPPEVDPVAPATAPWGIGRNAPARAGTALLERERAGPSAGLRSFREVEGYRVSAQDGVVGVIEDLLVDDQSWEVHHVVIDARHWIPGRKLVVAPGDILRLSWPERGAKLELERAEIENTTGVEVVPAGPTLPEGFGTGAGPTPGGTPRSEWIDRAKANLDEWDAALGAAEAKATRLTHRAKTEADEALDGARATLRHAHGEWSRVKNGAEETWDSLGEGISAAWEDSRRAFERSIAEVRAALRSL